MPITLNTTAADHIPEEFTVESLTAGGLTEQEIQALSEGDDPIVKLPDPEPDAQANAQAATIPADVGAPPAQQPQAQQPQPQAAPEPDPVIPQIPDTSEAEAAITRINTELETLADQYDAGDLTKAEFLAKQSALIKEQAKAQVFVEQAQQTVQQAQQAAVRHWESRLDAYKATAPELWSEQHIQGWDAHLRLVTGNPAYGDLTRDQQIQLAHKLYAAAYETKTGQKLASAPPAPKQDAKLETRKDPRPDPITTLGGFNSDTSAEVEDSAFAAVDRIKDPLEAEAAFARMTPEQQARYLAEV